jgi:PAS domain S-box-containing protein
VPPAAIAGVAMLVTATILVRSPLARARFAGQVLAMASVLAADFSIQAFLLGPTDPVGIVPYLYIPLSTGVAWVGLSGAILLAHTDEGPMTLLVGHDLAARVTRILLGVAFVGIALLGWLGRSAQDAGFIDTSVGTALFAALAAGALAVAAVVTGSLIRDYEYASHAARAERDSFVELAEDLFGIILPSGYLRWINLAWERTLGWTAPELLAVPIAGFVHPDDADSTNALWLPHATGGRRVAFENRMRHRDGSYRLVQWNVGCDPEARLTYADGRDVTGQRVLEANLLQAHKMEAVGQLAGGVAHDFSNVLTAIKGFAELIAGAGAPEEQRTADARQIGRAADQGADLIRQLLAFSRRQPVQLEELDLVEVAGSAAPMLRQLVGEGIAIEFSADPHLAHVLADRGQVEQVLLNLAANARDAMPDGGNLRLAVSTVLLDREFVQVHPGARAGAHVVLSMSDTGSGMDETTLAHIFEPFFTTKPPGKGTGLGLAGAYGIVKQAGGYIEAESAPGHGSTFRMFLPAVPPSRGAADVATEPAHEQAHGTETILLVEDEAGVRLFAQRALEAQGYHVCAFEDPAEALDAVMSDPMAFDALVTDVVMPGMSGGTLAERVRGLRARLPVLFMSGYAPGRLADRSAPRLAKPFNGAELAHAVGALFGRGA